MNKSNPLFQFFFVDRDKLMSPSTYVETTNSIT